VVNAFAINVLRVSSFITTLGLSSIVTGFTAYLTGGQTVTAGIPLSLVSFTQFTWLGVPRLVFVVVIIGIMLWLFLSATPLGRQFYAVGMNRESSRLMGAHVKRDIAVAFVVSGMLAALAGVFELGTLQSVQPNVGAALLLPALAVAFLGASTIRPGWFNVWGTLIGVLVVQTGIVGLDDVGAPYWMEPIFDGAVLVAAVAVSVMSFAPMRAHLLKILRAPQAGAPEQSGTVPRADRGGSAL
jgi:ribose transport system permease protein